MFGAFLNIVGGIGKKTEATPPPTLINKNLLIGIIAAILILGVVIFLVPKQK